MIDYRKLAVNSSHEKKYAQFKDELWEMSAMHKVETVIFGHNFQIFP